MMILIIMTTTKQNNGLSFSLPSPNSIYLMCVTRYACCEIWSIWHISHKTVVMMALLSGTYMAPGQLQPSWWHRVVSTWWRHQMKTFSALLALCAGNSPVIGEFPTQWPVTRSFAVSLNCAWINSWVNNRSADDLSRHHAPYDVIVMYRECSSVMMHAVLFQMARRSPLWWLGAASVLGRRTRSQVVSGINCSSASFWECSARRQQRTRRCRSATVTCPIALPASARKTTSKLLVIGKRQTR